tara:strand:- start:113 stop:1768 length:1656 start_codon:yes stop_codon:yes gene_type:complete
MAQEVRLKLTADDKASKVIKGTSTELKGATAQTTLLGGAMNTVKGAMLKVKAVSKLLFGSIKAGLISTGIGAFVVVIGSLVAYFTKTKKGAELLEQAFAGIGAAVAVITDRISKIGGAIAKVFSGDFKGAAEDVKGALSGIGEEIVAEAKAASRLKKELQDIKDVTREFNIEKAKTRQEIAKALLLAEDETKSSEVRRQALQDALKLEEETTAKELELQARRVAAIEEEVGLGESLEEDLERLNEAKIRLIELETASIKQRKKVVTQVNAFDLEIAAAAKARAKERADEEKELTKIKEEEAEKQRVLDEKTAADNLKQEQTEAETLRALKNENDILDIEDAEEKALALLEIEQQKALDRVAGFENAEELIFLIEQKYAKKKKKVTDAGDKAEKLTEEQKNKAKIDLANQALGQLSGLLKKGSKEQKAVAIAQTIMSTREGMQKAITGSANLGPTGVALGYVNAALVLATGLSNVKAITATNPSGGGSMGSAAGGVSSGASVSASIPALEGLPDVVSAINNQGQQPVEAFVISQNVTDAQEAQTYINQQRTL